MQNLVLALFSAVGETHILKLDGLQKALQPGRAGPLFHVVLGIEEGEDGQ